MNFRTTFEIEPSKKKVNYSTPVMFIGSCFSSEMGNMMAAGKMTVNINPAGTVFNPVSVLNTLDIIIKNKKLGKRDLYNYKGTFLSFLHYSSFNSENPERVLEKINESTRRAHDFLRKAEFLFVTFGTSRVFRFNESGEIVSNCHKIPSSVFTRELLTPGQIAVDWDEMLGRLESFNKKLKIIFTVSPVRHWKDGAHGNQVSKSALFLAIEKLLEHKSTGYFPAYELIMDDLRDYRFYDTDMIHPSGEAISYIWDAFRNCYFDPETSQLWKEIYGITMAMNHRFISDSPAARREFAETMLKKIDTLGRKNREIDFSGEIAYFISVRENN